MRLFPSKIGGLLKPKLRWFRFRLRTMFIVMALVAVVAISRVGVWGPFSRQRQTAI